MYPNREFEEPYNMMTKLKTLWDARIATAMLVTMLASMGLMSGGCAHLRTSLAGSFIADVAAATAKHDDVELVSSAIPIFLLLIDGLLDKDPDNKQLLTKAAEAYTLFGAIVEMDDPIRARRLYRRAKGYGFRALAQNAEVARLLEASYRDFSVLPELLEEDDLNAVFWTASSWGAWISVNLGSIAALADLPRVILLMEWVLEKDEAIFNASPHLFLGIYHAARPQLLGGRPQQALFHFERALELTEEQSATVLVQMARFYAVQAFDRELYVSLLNRALAIPVDIDLELTLQNAAAHRLARRLLAEVNEIF